MSQQKSFDIAKSTIESLANSQGFYSRLKMHMEETEWMPLWDLCADHEFNDAIEFILYLEA